jgi:peroxiredoxin
MLRSMIILCIVVFVPPTVPVSAELPQHVGRTITGFKLRDHRGTWRSLEDFAKNRLIVVAFLGTECPLSKLNGARLAELSEQYSPRDVAFIGINSNHQDTPTEIAHYAQALKIGFPILKDPGNEIADQFRAQRTPEVFVLDQKLVIRYWGRIDDQFGVGYVRPGANQSYLTDALDELLAGTDASRPEVEPVGCYIGRVVRRPPHGDITYSSQISGVLQARCVSCHRDDGIAPFALTSYEDAASWAETIREVIRDERMPPWHASPKHGKFANDARMPDEEKKLVDAWINNGMPEGDPAARPAVPEFVEAWRIGKPDLIVRMPEPFTVPATGVVPYQHIVVDPGITEDKWVRASEARPGSSRAVHHILAFIQPPGTKFSADRVGIGFEMIGGYVPGMPPMVLPEGTARLLPAGSKIVFQMHYTPTGTQETDSSELGLVFTDPQTVQKTIQMGAAVNTDFRIPAHAEDHTVRSNFRISHDTLLYSLMPHMHFRGKSFRYEALYPNGTREILLDVPRYDFNWQHIYYLESPKYLPAGTLMNCVAHFDNSEKNLANPDPNATVTWGEQTWEEMMIGYYEGVLINQDLSLPEPQIARVNDHETDVVFTYRPDRPARTVHLAGTFNGWNNSSHPLTGPDAEGCYQARVRLKRGTYQYKYVIDSDYWVPDPASPRLIGVLHETLLVVD